MDDLGLELKPQANLGVLPFPYTFQTFCNGPWQVVLFIHNLECSTCPFIFIFLPTRKGKDNIQLQSKKDNKEWKDFYKENDDNHQKTLLD